MTDVAPERFAGNDDDVVRVHTRAERGRFRCPHCGTSWVATYEVRDYRAPSGARWVVHVRDGQPVRGPHLGARCPACGRVSVPADRWPGPSPTDREPEAGD
jgi:predicted RNA-binding Zn-ribbon protein involved in translation (DUF1610 family)